MTGDRYERDCAANMRDALADYRSCTREAQRWPARSATRREQTKMAELCLALAVGWASR